MNDLSKLEEGNVTASALKADAFALDSAIHAAKTGAIIQVQPAPRRRKARETPPAAAPQGHTESNESGFDEIVLRLTAMSEHLQKMGKRIDALASYKNIVLLHQSLHPGVAETRQLIEQVEQATTRIEAGLNIDLQRLRNGSDIDGAAQVSENEKQRLGRLEWMLRATLGVVVVQMMVMTVWLLR